MRFFPADHVPGLSVSAAEMPGPWVVPWYFPRRHKERLWSLLVEAMRRFDDRLHFVDLRWAERRLVEEGKILLRRPLVVRWRFDVISMVEPQVALAEVNRLSGASAVLDFDRQTDLLGFGWLGPFKVRLLHRIIDVVLDEPPFSARDV